MVAKIKLPQNNSEMRLQLIGFFLSNENHARQGNSGAYLYLRFKMGLLGADGAIITDNDGGVYEIRLQDAQLQQFLSLTCNNQSLAANIIRLCNLGVSSLIPGSVIEP